jgi:hypothetical protein
VACGQDAQLARIPVGLDPVTAAALPTASVTAVAIAESLAPRDGKIVLIVGAAGGIDPFLTQFAAQAGAHVDAVAPAAEAESMTGYGAAETIDRAAMPLPDAVARTHPDGIDVLVDVPATPGSSPPWRATCAPAAPRSPPATSPTRDARTGERDGRELRVVHDGGGRARLHHRLLVDGRHVRRRRYRQRGPAPPRTAGPAG